MSLVIYGDASIYKYPGSTLTTAAAYATTKQFDHIRAVFNRFRFDFSRASGTTEIDTKVTSKNTVYTDTHTALANSDANEWQWITNGKGLGSIIQFVIAGADSILSGLYDYKSRGKR